MHLLWEACTGGGWKQTATTKNCKAVQCFHETLWLDSDTHYQTETWFGLIHPHSRLKLADSLLTLFRLRPKWLSGCEQVLWFVSWGPEALRQSATRSGQPSRWSPLSSKTHFVPEIYFLLFKHYDCSLGALLIIKISVQFYQSNFNVLLFLCSSSVEANTETMWVNNEEY